MKIDIMRAIEAPFKQIERANAAEIFLIAFGITFASFTINSISGFVGNIAGSISQIGMSEEMAKLYTVIIAVSVGLVASVGIILLMCFVNGYILETAKREVENNPIIMPMWQNNFKTFFMKGLKLFGIYLVYGLIIGIILAVPLGIILGALAYMPSSDGTSGTFGLMFIAASCLLGLFVIALSVCAPMMQVHYAVTNSFMEGFNIPVILEKIMGNLIDYIVAWLVMIGILILSIIPYFILCCTCIGMVFVPLIWQFILPIIFMNLIAQVYKE